MVNAAAELGTADNDVNSTADDLFTRIEEVFRQAIAQGQESGEFAVDQIPDTAASQLLASVVGLSVLVKSGGASERFRAVIDGIVDGL
jgi:TetR/AcrR family transcriptional repressor of nem operon